MQFDSLICYQSNFSKLSMQRLRIDGKILIRFIEFSESYMGSAMERVSKVTNNIFKHKPSS